MAVFGATLVPSGLRLLWYWEGECKHREAGKRPGALQVVPLWNHQLTPPSLHAAAQ